MVAAQAPSGSELPLKSVVIYEAWSRERNGLRDEYNVVVKGEGKMKA